MLRVRPGALLAALLAASVGGRALALPPPKVRAADAEQLVREDYTVTQVPGEFARDMGYDGLIAPSARDPGGVNYVLFPLGPEPPARDARLDRGSGD